MREAEELRALLRVLADTHAATLAAIDRTERKLAALLARTRREVASEGCPIPPGAI